MDLLYYGTTASLNVKDLACPTWGLGRSTKANGTVITTIGPPFLPLIVPPEQALTLDPTWSSMCTGIDTAGLDVWGSFVIFDPPQTLVPEARLAAASSTRIPAAVHADPMTTPPAPSTIIARPITPPSDPNSPPAETGDLQGNQGPSKDPKLNDNSLPATPIGNPKSSAIGGDDPTGGVETSLVANSIVIVALSGDGPINSILFPPQHVDQSIGDLSKPSDTSGKALQSSPQVGDDPQPKTPGLGAIIYNALGKSGPGTGGTEAAETIALPSSGVHQTTTIGGHVMSLDSSGVDLEGNRFWPGGPAMTVSGSVYTVVPYRDNTGNVANVDPNDLANDPPSATSPLMIAGHTVVQNPSGVFVDGSSLDPGGAALTLASTPVSLNPSGVLVIGTSTTTLASQSTFNIGTQAFTADPTGFTINGVTISPGGGAQTIDGTIISLGSSGNLFLGGSTIIISSPTSTDPMNHVLVIAGQTITANPSAFSIAGTAISAGGPAATIDGTPIKLGPSGILAIGSSTLTLPILTPTTSPIIIAGQAINSDQAISIAGTPLSVGGPAITTDGTVVSLGPSGLLAVGSSTYTLPIPAPTLSSNENLIIAGQAITPNPTAFSIAGTTISAGGPPATIYGTVVSLETSGTLIVGSSTLLLATPAASMFNIDGFSVQEEPSFAVVDGVTMTPGAPAITVAGSVVSLEQGGKTVDVGSGRFALPTVSQNGTAGLQVFDGGQKRGVEVTLSLLASVWMVWMMLIRYGS